MPVEFAIGRADQAGCGYQCNQSHVGGTRARIGSTIYAGRYYSGVQAIDTDNVDIFSITISRDGTTYQTSASFGIDEVPTLDASNISVTLA